MSELTTPAAKLPPLRNVAPLGKEGKSAGNVREFENIQTELLDDNLAAFLLAGGVDVGGLMTLLNEYLDFTRVKESPLTPKGGTEYVDPMEVLEAWYLRDGIGDFIERLRHDSGRIGKAANAAAVRKGKKALGEGEDKQG